MSDFVVSVDEMANNRPLQFGEKGHLEYTWNMDDVQDGILQIFFQLVRRSKCIYYNSNDDDVWCESSVVAKIDVMLSKLFGSSLSNHSDDATNLLSVMFRMLAQTRDIENGKGECRLAYEFLYVWSKYHAPSAYFMMEDFVHRDDETAPLGSWKDAKYMCNFIAMKLTKKKEKYLCGKDVYEVWVTEKRDSDCCIVLNDPFIRFICNMVITQLRHDEKCLKEDRCNSLSLVGKWVPREHCKKFGWINCLLSILYYHGDHSFSGSTFLRENEYIKCRVRFRKLLSALNKKLDTAQIKFCSKQWSCIDFNKLTSKTLLTQRSALLNKGKNVSQEEDRVRCAELFSEFIASKVKDGSSIKGSKVMMNEFTSNALSLSRQSSDCPDVMLLNKQWEDSSSKTNALGKVVAMVDVSGSMNGDPLHAAIALGIRVAEKSSLGRRVLTFETEPAWVNLDKEKSFVSMVKKLAEAPWGGSTNLYKALDMVLSAIETKKLPADEVKGMVLAIFSDMQVDACDSSWNLTLHESIIQKYHDVGIRCCGEPYDPPHILFWNLRCTDGFPATSQSENVTMLAGFSAALLNAFSENGVDGLMKQTGYENLVSILGSARYDKYETALRSMLVGEK